MNLQLNFHVRIPIHAVLSQREVQTRNIFLPVDIINPTVRHIVRPITSDSTFMVPRQNHNIMPSPLFHLISTQPDQFQRLPCHPTIHPLAFARAYRLWTVAALEITCHPWGGPWRLLFGAPPLRLPVSSMGNPVARFVGIPHAYYSYHVLAQIWPSDRLSGLYAWRTIYSQRIQLMTR